MRGVPLAGDEEGVDTFVRLQSEGAPGYSGDFRSSDLPWGKGPPALRRGPREPGSSPVSRVQFTSPRSANTSIFPFSFSSVLRRRSRIIWRRGSLDLYGYDGSPAVSSHKEASSPKTCDLPVVAVPHTSRSLWCSDCSPPPAKMEAPPGFEPGMEVLQTFATERRFGVSKGVSC